MATTITSLPGVATEAERPKSIDAPPSRGRVGGLDLARAIAILGMLIVHFVVPADTAASSDSYPIVPGVLSGRAMPLFLVLGGVGVTFLTKSRAKPWADLTLRALILLAIGVLLSELDTPIAIVLQAYAFFFVVAPLLRRVPLSGLVVISTVIGLGAAWTSQVFVGGADRAFTASELLDPVSLTWRVLFSGYYPLFAAGAFFVVGLALGRLPLHSSRLATRLALGGGVLTVAPLLVHLALADTVAESDDVGSFDVSPSFEAGAFAWSSLLSIDGHSQMPLWVVSAVGSSLAVIGAAILLAQRFPRATRPAQIVGRMALTLYVTHVLIAGLIVDSFTQTAGQQWATVAIVGAVFVAFALVWDRVLGVGPLERVLRIRPDRLVEIAGRQRPREV